MTVRTVRDVLAKLLRLLEPYAQDIVLIGGWVHALYLAELSTDTTVVSPPILTDDVDFTIPRILEMHGRPALLDLVAEAGFELDVISQMEDATVMLRQTVGREVIDLDLLTDVDPPGTRVPIDGQAGLVISGYPGQSILLENTQWMSVGVAVHATLNPPIQIRIPTLSAYLFHKGLSSAQRRTEHKQGKDLAYMAEILRHPVLGPMALAGLRQIALQYPTFHWHQDYKIFPRRSGARRKERVHP